MLGGLVEHERGAVGLVADGAGGVRDALLEGSGDLEDGLAVTKQSERGRLARSGRPKHGRERFGRRAKLSLNRDPRAVASPTVSGLSTP